MDPLEPGQRASTSFSIHYTASEIINNILHLIPTEREVGDMMLSLPAVYLLDFRDQLILRNSPAPTSFREL